MSFSPSATAWNVVTVSPLTNPFSIASPKSHQISSPIPTTTTTTLTTDSIKKFNSSNESRRRSFVLSLFPFFLFPFPHSSSSLSLASPLLKDLKPFTDSTEGFTLLVPSSWSKVEKAGATALFEEGKGSNSIGVVVSPVRISSLRDFGAPEFVADKLIQAEKRKESTKHAEVIAVTERLGHGGLPVYEFEYIVDSTRGGMKRIFSAAFVSSKKLCLLNIAYSDRSDSPLDGQTRSILEKVLHSFDVAL